MDIQLGNVSDLNLLWIVAAAVGVMIFAAVARRRALARFATANLVGRLAAAGSSARQVAKAALVTAALVALVLGLLDIRWGKVWREVPQKGIEVMFVLDVSRSMLAEDATPNRLERAKQQIGDMLDAMAGDRVGLVAFAGDARQLVPLTSHYHDFKQTLSEVGPQDVDRGGSRLGDALKLAADSFLDQTGDHKAVVVFTDGEDQESEPVKMAEQLHRDQGIRVFTVGLGDMDQGARIPVQQPGRGRSYLQHDGRQVWSKMNGAALKQVALATGGAYIPAGTKQVEMSQVYHKYVAQVEQQDFETARINSYVPRYQWLVGLGLLLLVIDTLLPAARRNRRSRRLRRSRTRHSSKNTVVADNRSLVTSAASRTATVARKKRLAKNGQSTGTVVAAACLAMLFLTPQSSSAAEPARLVHQANEALRAGKVDQALADYQQAAENDPNRPELLYNQAVAQYRNGQFKQARQLFAQAATSADNQLDAKARYNLANCDYSEALQLAEKDKPAAIERLRSAISHYRGALDANSADTDARANIQLAQMLIDRLQKEEEQKKQQQQQQQDKQDQNKQNQDKQNQDKQDQQNKQDNQQENKDEQNKQDQQSKQDEQNQDKQDQDKQDQDKQKQDEQDKQNEKQDQQPQDKQPQDKQSGDSKDESPDEKEQPQPDKNESGQPDQQEKQEPPQDQQQPAAGQPSGTPQFGHDDATSAAESRPMTKEEAQKMLQAVRDRELMRRLQQQRQSQRRRVPVDRDW